MTMGKEQKKRIKQLKKDSGNVESDDPLVAFLYELIRDHITPGKNRRNYF